MSSGSRSVLNGDQFALVQTLSIKDLASLFTLSLDQPSPATERHINLRADPFPASPKLSTIESTLTLLGDVRAAETLESDLYLVGLQPTRQSIGLHRCAAPLEFSLDANIRWPNRVERRCDVRGISEDQRLIRNYSDHPVDATAETGPRSGRLCPERRKYAALTVPRNPRSEGQGENRGLLQASLGRAGCPTVSVW
jgi:hypothetical protein